MPYQVVWTKCNVFFSDSESQTLERGAYLPGGLDDIQVSQLATVGAVQFVDGSLSPVSAASIANAPLATGEPVDTGDLPLQATVVQDQVAVEEVESDSALAFDAPTEEKASPPAQSAAKAEWVEFAVSQGLSEDEAQGLSKAELTARYGS